MIQFFQYFLAIGILISNVAIPSLAGCEAAFRNSGKADKPAGFLNPKAFATSHFGTESSQIVSGLFLTPEEAIAHIGKLDMSRLYTVVRHRGVIQGVFERTNRNLDSLVNMKSYPINLLRPQFWTGLRALDVGCGGGALVEQLRQKGVDMEGIDRILMPAQKEKAFFHEAPFEQNFLPPGSYDFVFLNNIFYIYDVKESQKLYATFKELKRVTAVDGLVYISPAYDGAIHHALEHVGGFIEVTEKPMNWKESGGLNYKILRRIPDKSDRVDPRDSDSEN